MKSIILLLTGLALLHSRSAAQVLPAGESETLTYDVNWPSGLSLGEAQFKAAKVNGDAVVPRLELNMSLDAAIPGFTVADRYRSITDSGFCSSQFEKEIARGKKIGKERIVFDQTAGTAKRETIGGGNSQLVAPPCAKDALAFLYHLRRELSLGRLPSDATVFFGGPYEVRLQFAGRQKLTIGGQQFEADKITGSVKGKASETAFELFLAQDKARCPLLLRVPLALGTFSMELVP